MRMNRSDDQQTRNNNNKITKDSIPDKEKTRSVVVVLSENKFGTGVLQINSLHYSRRKLIRNNIICGTTQALNIIFPKDTIHQGNMYVLSRTDSN